MSELGSTQHRRLLLTTILLLIGYGLPTQGHNDKKKEHDHSHHGLGDFADENAEISNPLRQNDFIKHKECVCLFTLVFAGDCSAAKSSSFTILNS